METAIQVGVLVLVALAIVAVALLIPVIWRVRRTVEEAERTLVDLRGQVQQSLQQVPPTLNQLQQVIRSADTILTETRSALMPAVQQAGATLEDELIPSAREALITVRHLLKVAHGLVQKIERIERMLSAVETVTHPQKAVGLVKRIVSSPLSRPSVWLDALRKGYEVLVGKQVAETSAAAGGSMQSEKSPAELSSQKQKGGETHVEP